MILNSKTPGRWFTLVHVWFTSGSRGVNQHFGLINKGFQAVFSLLVHTSSLFLKKEEEKEKKEPKSRAETGKKAATGRMKTRRCEPVAHFSTKPNKNNWLSCFGGVNQT